MASTSHIVTPTTLAAETSTSAVAHHSFFNHPTSTMLTVIIIAAVTLVLVVAIVSAAVVTSHFLNRRRKELKARRLAHKKKFRREARSHALHVKRETVDNVHLMLAYDVDFDASQPFHVDQGIGLLSPDVESSDAYSLDHTSYTNHNIHQPPHPHKHHLQQQTIHHPKGVRQQSPPHPPPLTPNTLPSKSPPTVTKTRNARPIVGKPRTIVDRFVTKEKEHRLLTIVDRFVASETELAAIHSDSATSESGVEIDDTFEDSDECYY
eukprot:m.35748 g.35748  ORF g.35748 m.35748 type:complete len:265 (-) comp17196_c0_seq1:222-1016(-)